MQAGVGGGIATPSAATLSDSSPVTHNRLPDSLPPLLRVSFSGGGETLDVWTRRAVSGPGMCANYDVHEPSLAASEFSTPAS